MKNRNSSALKETVISIGSYPINMCVVYTTSYSIRSNEAHESHKEMAFLLLLHLFFCFSFGLFLLVLCNRYFEFCETQRKDI